MREKELKALREVQTDSEYLWTRFNAGTLTQITSHDRSLLVGSPIIQGDRDGGVRECFATLNKPIFMQKELTRQMVRDVLFRICAQTKFVEESLKKFSDSLLLAEFHAGPYKLSNASWQDPMQWNDYIVRKNNKKSALNPLLQLREKIHHKPLEGNLIHEAIGACHSYFPPRIAYITGETRGHVLGYILWREETETDTPSKVLDLGIAQRLSEPTSALAQMLIRASHSTIDPVAKKNLHIPEHVVSDPISSY